MERPMDYEDGFDRFQIVDPLANLWDDEEDLEDDDDFEESDVWDL